MHQDEIVEEKQKEIPLEVTDEEGMKRHLQGRHLQMIAIGGTIGTGLFIKTGDLIANAGPLGALLAYFIAGFSVLCVVLSLGEMATMIPISGSFNAYADRFVEPALGFTSGWSYWLQWALTLPVEIQVCASLVGYWFPEWNQLVVSMVILVVILALNLFSVKGYGEAEYWLSIIKVLAIVLFIFSGFFVVFRDKIGFSSWNHPDPLGGNGVFSIFSVMVSACFAFGGTELVGITAGEAHNPRKSVPRAINGTFWRIAIFYILSVIVIGLLLPADVLVGLKSASSLLKSPFVIGFKRAGIPSADSIMNFVALVAVFSAGNSAVYASSRTMMALCNSGQGPALLGKTSKYGVPVAAILVTTVFGAISFLSSLIGTGELFDWLVNSVGLYIIVTWMMICVAHIRFRKAYIAQGYKLEDLPYKSAIGVTGDYIGLAILFVILIFSGTGEIIFNGAPFVALKFLYDYVGLIAYPLLYFGYKIVRRSKLRQPEDVDLQTGHINNHEEHVEDTSKASKWIDYFA